jgi:hypothetical protein
MAYAEFQHAIELFYFLAGAAERFPAGDLTKEQKEREASHKQLVKMAEAIYGEPTSQWRQEQSLAWRGQVYHPLISVIQRLPSAGRGLKEIPVRELPLPSSKRKLISSYR